MLPIRAYPGTVEGTIIDTASLEGYDLTAFQFLNQTLPRTCI
jgi:hypothetical protein